MLTAPSMSPSQAAATQEIAPPDSVSVPVAVRPLVALAPMVMTSWLTASVTFPETAKLGVPRARVLPASSKPAVVREAIAAFTSTVTVQAATQEAMSMRTGLAAVGTAHPPAPPEESDHRAVSLQLPVPPTQQRFAPQA